MKSIIKMAFANLKRKKLQSLLIAIIIMASSLIFTTSLGILAGINSPFEQMHKKLNASHLLLVFDKDMHNSEASASWWKNQKEVSSVSSVTSCVLVESPIKDNKKVETEFYMSEITPSVAVQDKLQVVDGLKKSSPTKDEIWIPTALAYSQNLKVGDKLDIPLPEGKKQLTISGIVVDPIFSTSLINPTRAWVAQGVLKTWYPEKSLNTVFIAVRYKDLSSEKVLWDRFGKFLGKPFSGIKFTYSIISMAFLLIYQLVGAMLLLFSIILLLIALYILSASITDAVISDYKTIGILKSQGFTPGNVVFIYTLQMAMLSILAIPLGIVLSTFAIRKVFESLLKALGMVDINMPLAAIFSLAFVILFGLILLSTYLTARKAGKVKPAEAIKYGAPVDDLLTRQSRLARVLRKLPVVPFVGTNQLLASKRQVVFSFLTFCATVFVLVIGINSYNSMAGIAQNSAYIGFDNSDVTITIKDKANGMDNKEMQSKIQADNRVQNVLQTAYLLTGVIPANDKQADYNIIGNNFDGNMDDIGYQNVDGKNPNNDNEIALATNTAKTYNMKPGDDFRLYVEGKPIDFKVSGIYQTFNNMGQGYRIQTKAVNNVSPEYRPDTFIIKLKNNKEIDTFMKDMNKEFGETVDVAKTKEMFSRIMKPIVTNLGMAIILINIVFIIVLVLTIFSSSLLSIHKQKKNFGIFKTVGMTPTQVRLSIVVRYLLTGALAIIIGTAAGLFLTPVLMTAMCSSMGVLNFPISINVVQTILIIPFCVLLAFICSWIPSRQVSKIYARTLVSE